MGDINKNDFLRIESYVVRRRLASKGTSEYADKCGTIINNGTAILENEMEAVDSGMTDLDIERLLLYPNEKFARLVLFIIELYLRRDGKQDVSSLNFIYTLEHIMPKKWEEKWSDIKIVKEDGSSYIEDGKIIGVKDDYGKKIRNEHINSFGNMTLLTFGLNASIKNGPFNIKINGDGKKKEGYRKHSDLRITKGVIGVYEENREWNEAEIEKRGHIIAKLIKEIWPIRIC